MPAHEMAAFAWYQGVVYCQAGEWIRALLIKGGDRIHIRSRNDKDPTPMYPRVAAARGITPVCERPPHCQ
jgi:hypothetical protein